ncbi:hypothetical protein DL768_000946 [Monosporascus sp. mg162]|nr:hypothetical protein DL768_000946 [Monosporascus sp. mg162]
MSYSSFTKSLLSSPSVAELYERATRNQFLELAGKGRLPRETLSEWLAQDRLYCQAYARFVGGLISRVHLPIARDRPIAETLEWRVLTLLHSALGGIMAEIQLFEKTAGDYGLDLEAVGSGMEGEAVGFGPYKTTQGYIDLFDSFAAQPGAQTDKPLREGLLVLWATEVAYLDSWSHAKSQSPQNPDPSQDLDGGALRKHLIGNWTSDQFRVFVKEIEECLEALAAQADDTEEVLLASSLSVLKKVLVLEEEFWPIVA